MIKVNKNSGICLTGPVENHISTAAGESSVVPAASAALPILPLSGDYSLLDDKWSCPLQIYTFARFNMIRNGALIEFTGKVQQKPLAMLKILIALGGRNIRQTRIIDLLWPEAEKDVANQSHKTTLHRLRRLIGYEQAVQVREGCLSLNQRYCWVDTWSFERMCGMIDTLRADNAPSALPEEAARLADKAMSLYSGHFLVADNGLPWALSTRERLRSKFVRMILNTGYFWEKSYVWHKAAECYQRGLEIDDQVEEFYQRLLACYSRLGKNGEAQLLYDRCRAVLAMLGVKPSTVTKAAYETAISS